MTKKEKLLERAQRNPSGLRFQEFETLLSSCGWVMDHQIGSHRIWYATNGFRLSVQVMKNGKAKGYQVKQFLKKVENGSI